MPPIEQSGVALDRKSLDMVSGSMRLLGDRILIKPMALKLSTTLIADWKGKTVRGQVIAVGPGEYANIYNSDRSKVRRSKAFTPTTVKVGDIVHLGGLEIDGYSFTRIMLNGTEHLICSEKDITGVETNGH